MNRRVARWFTIILLVVAGFLIYNEVTQRYGGPSGNLIKLQTPFTKCDLPTNPFFTR
jgi:hypothetical protein